jgi:ubiquitin-conjugating enzyme E2 G1
MSSRALLLREFTSLKKNPRSTLFSVYELVDESPFEWVVFVLGPPDTCFEGGVFRATMRFPDTYPMQPPSLQFTSTIHHPNIFRDGKVCISTLQAPPPAADVRTCDVYWRPVLGAEQALLSVVSLIGDPNCDDPANPTAANEWREDRGAFSQKVRTLCARSRENLPADFVYPKVSAPAPPPPAPAPRPPPSRVCDDDDDEEYVYSDEEEEEGDSAYAVSSQQQQCCSPSASRVKPLSSKELGAHEATNDAAKSKEASDDFVIACSLKRPPTSRDAPSPDDEGLRKRISPA